METLFLPNSVHLTFSSTTYRVRENRFDPKKLRNREKKWLEMLSNWSYYMTEKYEKVRERCRKGIPPSLRGRAWKNLCGASFHMDFGVNKDVFDVSLYASFMNSCFYNRLKYLVSKCY